MRDLSSEALGPRLRDGSAAPAADALPRRCATRRSSTPDVAASSPRGAALLAALVLCASPPALDAQERPAGVTPEMVRQGREVFTGDGFCYTCHGSEGRGMPGLGSDLADGEWVHTDGSFEELVSRIRQGVPANSATTGVPMPPRGGAALSEEQIRAVAAYVWTLSRGGG